MFKVIKYCLFIALFCILLSINKTNVLAASATLSLSPASQSVTAGSTFNVQVILNTGGAKTSGTDVHITFDKDKLDLLDITNGSIYDQYVGKSINNDTGAASLSGLASSSTTLYTGSGTFATLRFRAVTAGTANVTFNFTPGNKNDSNVADFDTQTDALTSVTNGSYTVTGTSSGSSTSNTSSNTAGGTSGTTTNSTTRTSALPVTADVFPLIALVGISIVLLGSGFFLMKYIKR